MILNYNVEILIVMRNFVLFFYIFLFLINNVSAKDFLISTNKNLIDSSFFSNPMLIANDAAANIFLSPNATLVRPCKNQSNGSISINMLVPIRFERISNGAQRIQTNQYLLDNLKNYTMEAWIRFDKSDIQSGGLYSIMGQDDLLEFGIAVYNSPAFHIWGQNNSSGYYTTAYSSYPDDNDWHHIAVVASNRNYIMYVDGSEVDRSSRRGRSVGSHPNGSTTTCIGGVVFRTINQRNDSFVGDICKVGFWNRPLSSNEILNLYQSHSSYSNSDSGLIAGYNFSEGQGNTIAPIGINSGVNASITSIVGNPPYWNIRLSNGASTKNISNLSEGTYSLIIDNIVGGSDSYDYTLTSIDMSLSVSGLIDDTKFCISKDLNLDINLDPSTIFPLTGNSFIYKVYLNNVLTSQNTITLTQLDVLLSNMQGSTNIIKVEVEDINGCKVVWQKNVEGKVNVQSQLITIP